MRDQILAGIVRDLTEWSRRPVVNQGLPYGSVRRGEWRIRVEDAKNSVAKLAAGDRIGRASTPADRKAAQRALEALERDGLIRRLRLGPDKQRVTHVMVTPIGWEAALSDIVSHNLPPSGQSRPDRGHHYSMLPRSDFEQDQNASTLAATSNQKSGG